MPRKQIIPPSQQKANAEAAAANNNNTAVASKRRGNDPFAGATEDKSGGGGSGTANLEKALAAAKKSGSLNVSGRKLTAFPERAITDSIVSEPEVGKAAKRDPNRISKPNSDDKWWEVEPLKSIDIVCLYWALRAVR